MSTIQFHSMVDFLLLKADFHKIWIFPCCSGKTLCLDLVWLLGSFPCTWPHLLWVLPVKPWCQKYIPRLQWWSWLLNVSCLSCLASATIEPSSAIHNFSLTDLWFCTNRTHRESQVFPFDQYFLPMVWAYVGRLKNLCAPLTCGLKSLAMCSYAVAQYAPQPAGSPV